MKISPNLGLILVAGAILIISCIPRTISTPVPTSLPASPTAPRATATPPPPSTPAAQLTLTPTPSVTPTTAPPELAVSFSDGDAWLWSQSQGIIRLTSTGDVIWVALSHDRQRVAFLRQIDQLLAQLWVVNADGSDERLLVGEEHLAPLAPVGEQAGIFQADWTPGAHRLAYNTHILGYGLLKNDDLNIVDADTLEHTTLFPPGLGGDFYYSPDGGMIALVTAGDYQDIPGSITLARADGSDRLEDLVNFPSILTYSEFAYYPEVRWADDGSAILVAIPSQDPLAPDANTTVWRISTEGGQAAPLHTMPSSLLRSGPVHLSPDLVWAAYLYPQGEQETNRYELRIASLESPQEVVYTTGRLDYFAWLPGTERFVFTLDEDLLWLGELGSDPVELGIRWDFRNLWVDGERYLSVDENTAGANVDVYLAGLNGERDFLFTIYGSGPVILDFPGE